MSWLWSWSLVYGLMLFGLGLISLFTGHVASDLEWYSQRLVMNTKQNGNGREVIDVWKSSYSKFYYGCSKKTPRYAPDAPLWKEMDARRQNDGCKLTVEISFPAANPCNFESCRK
ncbi:hypothetical protein EV2_019214 [Malus domestica]